MHKSIFYTKIKHYNKRKSIDDSILEAPHVVQDKKRYTWMLLTKDFPTTFILHSLTIYNQPSKWLWRIFSTTWWWWIISTTT